MEKAASRAAALIGLATYGAAAVGIMSFILAFMAFARFEYAGAGLALLAGAVAFGHLSNALLRR